MSKSAVTDTESVRTLILALRSLAPAVDDSDRIERVRLFEELKSVAAAAQAIEACEFEVSQRTAQAVVGVPAARQGRGIASQIALARRASPWSAQRWLGWAGVLSRELPHTFAALRSGQVSEWRATLIARETIWLSKEDRAAVDAELAPKIADWSDRQVEAEARRAAYRLDPRGSMERSRNAETDRRVTIRPAPDTMTRLTALLPVKLGVAAYAALCAAADTTTAGGDERGRGQIMADTLVERLTGQATADAVPVQIELIMTDQTLFGRDHSESPNVAQTDAADEPGVLIGYGPIPAGLAREFALDGDAPRWLRRLFLHPESGQLAAMETTARLFTKNQQLFIRLREQGICRTPYCGAPIRHTDHVQPHGQGGRTHVANGDGHCETCNYSKQAPGWQSTTAPDGTINTRTPTSHHYSSRPLDPLGRPPGPAESADRRVHARQVSRRPAA